MPTTVYLDTADWAYLEEGKAPDVVTFLSELGETGAAVFVVSHEHWVEVAGLSHGLARRLDFIRRFPGTQRVVGSTNGLLAFDAQQLVRAVSGRGAAGASLPLEPLAGVPLSELRRWVEHFGRFVRAVDKHSTSLQRSRRALGDARTAKAIRAEHRNLGAFLRGDAEGVVRHLARGGRVPGRAQNWLLRKSVSLVGRVAGELHRRGRLPFAELTYDPVFSATVVPLLESAARTNPEVLDAIYAYWRTRGNRSVAPSLACQAALAERLEMQPDLRLLKSEAADARHAAYAPLVDLFTCDKRNRDPLRKALAEIGCSTLVVGTKRHKDLVGALEN